MVKATEGTLRKAHKGANTLLLTIPAKMVLDSEFPFKYGEKVKIEIKVVDEIPAILTPATTKKLRTGLIVTKMER